VDYLEPISSDVQNAAVSLVKFFGLID